MSTWFLLVPLALVAAAWISLARFEARIRSDEARVLGARPAMEPGRELPPLLRGYLERSGARAAVGMAWVRIEQRGEMRLKPNGPWLPFTALQHDAIAEPWFVWRARFKTFRVVDSVVAGVGRLEARLFGILPVARASGAGAARGQLLRYLGELAWAPHAIAHNPCLTWEAAGAAEVTGVLEDRGQRVELRFHFDEQGDLVRVEGIRERETAGAAVPTPWVGRFSDYRTLDGVRIPTRGEVQWILDSGPFVYWRATVTSVRAG